MRGSSQTTFSSTLALLSVIFFIFSTIIICVCAYCFNFKKICLSIFFFLRPTNSLSRQKYEYHQASTHRNSHIFLNDHFFTETPMPSDEMPWRNAVIMGTPPYRKFTTISANFQNGDGILHDLSRQESDKRDCIISAV